MYFDPLSAWLVTLIADGIMVAGDKKGYSSPTERRRQIAKEYNDRLNGYIRGIQRRNGLTLAERSLNEIQNDIKMIKRDFSFQYSQGHIVIELDNQEYIIALLEKCADNYSKYSYEEAVNKAQWYRNAAIEARRRKEQYIKALEEARIKAAEEQRKQNITNTVLSVIAIILISIVVVIFLAQL